MRIAGALLLCVSLGSGCGAHGASAAGAVPPDGPTAEAAPLRGFVSPEGRDHPLAGVTLRVADGAPIGWARLLAELSDRRVVLLGERHDNPDHHRLQAEIYAALARQAPAPSAVFEMLDAGDQTTIDGLLDRPEVTPTALAEAVHWADSGWPAFELYAPVFEQVLGAHGSIVAAGLPRGQAMNLARGKALPAIGRFDGQLEARYALSTPLPPTLHAAMRALMQEAHCGVLPESMLDGMVHIQRVRDALLADAARLGVATTGRAVVIAGGGHVRRDRAVPRLLSHVGITDAAVVGFVEVDDERSTPDAYLQDAQGAFDYVVLTARLPAEDHCAELRKKYAAPAGDKGTAAGDAHTQHESQDVHREEPHQEEPHQDEAAAH